MYRPIVAEDRSLQGIEFAYNDWLIAADGRGFGSERYS